MLVRRRPLSIRFAVRKEDHTMGNGVRVSVAYGIHTHRGETS